MITGDYMTISIAHISGQATRRQQQDVTSTNRLKDQTTSGARMDCKSRHYSFEQGVHTFFLVLSGHRGIPLTYIQLCTETFYCTTHAFLCSSTGMPIATEMNTPPDIHLMQYQLYHQALPYISDHTHPTMARHTVLCSLGPR